MSDHFLSSWSLCFLSFFEGAPNFLSGFSGDFMPPFLSNLMITCFLFQVSGGQLEELDLFEAALDQQVCLMASFALRLPGSGYFCFSMPEAI